MNTKVFIDVFKGYKCFAIWTVDEHGNKTGKYPVVSVGTRKVAGLINHLDELKDFASKYCETPEKQDETQHIPTKLEDVF